MLIYARCKKIQKTIVSFCLNLFSCIMALMEEVWHWRWFWDFKATATSRLLSMHQTHDWGHELPALTTVPALCNFPAMMDYYSSGSISQSLLLAIVPNQSKRNVITIWTSVNFFNVTTSFEQIHFMVGFSWLMQVKISQVYRHLHLFTFNIING